MSHRQWQRQVFHQVSRKAASAGSGMRRPELGTGQPILTLQALRNSERFSAAWHQINNAHRSPECRFRNRKPHDTLELANE